MRIFLRTHTVVIVCLDEVARGCAILFRSDIVVYADCEGLNRCVDVLDLEGKILIKLGGRDAVRSVTAINELLCDVGSVKIELMTFPRELR